LAIQDHLGQYNLVEQVLLNEAAVVANRTAQLSPAIGANALVIVDLVIVDLAHSQGKRGATS
jgi:hypothetical protein